MPDLATMSWSKQGKIARVIFNRPHVLNAMDNQTTMDLNTIADAVAKEKDVRVVIISGEGRSFSSGIDLKQLARDEIDMTYHHRFEGALRKFETMEKIVIAAIKQYCLGGGLQLTLACDIRIAASNAILGLPAIKEGFIPGMGTWRLARYIGLGRAKRYVYSGENIIAREALAIGLVDYVMPLAQFDRRVEKIAQEYAKLTSTGTIQSKLLLPSSFPLDFEEFYQAYLKRQEIAMVSEDHKEARRAYIEKRDPVFK